MAQDLSAVFSRMQERKKQQRELKAMYRDALATNGNYQKVSEELEDLKNKKKQLENSIKTDFKEEFDKLEGLKLNIASDNQLLSDLALSEFSQGKLRRLVDENKVEYEPIFTVRFKKT
ncbi:MAG: hypothetical protein PHH52_01005 [Patescibacteria group bacterium]|jgi:predicted  nucleic acid-binding Zn-ribbon protein|nr:hypothetical protein [Patescibacteria group bacterium]MDD3777946.1 hypothetical protein [Patescibacteria group bacterium]MDD3939099.1 hypothetical protein [Patescibacteria group bacterium]MDD4443598.1 hypothetical protein [Patescibacteria group bacterium]NCU39332.1 hypothetical protein [Candidatus Falkowbacteria bacterium]